MASSGLSLYVHRVGEAEPVLSHLPDVPRNPASAMKLLTTLAALEILGPAYTWRTEAWVDGPIVDGRLQGNLYLKGYGDPYLVIEQFWRFVRAIRQSGIQTIGGDVVFDQEYFLPATVDPAEFDGRPTRAYNAQPSALLVNFQAVNLRFLPEPGLGKLAIVAEPRPASLHVDNRVKLVHEACRGWSRQLGMRVEQGEQHDTVVLTGSYPVACGANEMFRVLSQQQRYLSGVFKTLWAELGGGLEGEARHGMVNPSARLLYTHSSPALGEIVRYINKFSNNVMTGQLLLTLGAERQGAPGTPSKGIATLHAWLSERDLEFPELVLDNGAGLSRSERISARHLAKIVQAGLDSPYMPEFLASLPLMGMDGTLQRRSGGLSGRARLKTGSLDDVRSRAGIVTDRHGRQYILVALHNAARADGYAGEAVQEALLGWLDNLPMPGPVQRAVRPTAATTVPAAP